MSWIDGARSVARALLRRGEEERDLEEEIDFHLEMETEKLVRQGATPEEARRQARVRFGGVDRMKERTRDERGTRWLEDGWVDLRYAWRTLRRSPAFTVTAVLTLGLGIGATTAAFTLVDGVLLRPLPFDEPARLVELRELGDGRRFFPSFPNFQDWRRDARTLDGMIAVRPAVGPMPLLGAGDATVVPVLGVSRDFLSVLGVAPALGRDFTAEENAPGGANVAMLSHALWSTRFGADTDLERLGFTLFGEPYRVVGVLPPGFRLFYEADVYYPDERWPNTARASHAHRVVARLADDVTLDDAKADLDRMATAINEAYPGESQAETVQVRPLTDVVLGEHRRPLGILLGASALVLLLACANVASTLLARGSTRELEMGVRASLGAGRGRIVRQLFTEALVLAVLGSLVGIAVAYGAIGVASAWGGDVLPRLTEVRIGARSLAVTCGVSVLTALLFGLYPAARFASGGGSWARSSRGGSERNGRVWDALLVGESAFAVVLLVGAGLLVQSLMTIVRQDAGWSSDGVLQMSVTFPGGVFESEADALALADRLREELAALPGVQVVGIGTFGPLDAGMMTAPAREAGAEPRFDNYTGWRLVDGDYFRALDIRLLRGRLLEPTDVDAGVINESLATLLWPDDDPLGKRIVSNYDQSTPIEVVGVVADARDWRWERGSQTELYVPWRSRPGHIQGPLRFLIRTADDPAALAPIARERLRALNPSVPAELETLRSTLAGSVADRRFVASILLAFAGTGLVLALIGVFGVVAYTVERRRREIGIRMALGAETGRVRGEVRGRALRAVGLGVVIGAVGALAGSRFVEALLYEVEPRDPVTLLAVAILFLGTTALASELPARRASRVAPASVLKE